ncbi:MAG: thioredoxin domain-containing protein [Nitrospirales bacterium]|nr:DsbA family protein [Nitrospirales bacterium]
MKIVFFAFWGVLLQDFVWAQNTSPSNLSEQAVLQQLEKMHNELKALRNDIGQLRKDFLQLRQSLTSVVAPSPSPPQQVDVFLGDGQILGDSNANIGIVEFTDFQCPFCKRNHFEAFSKLQEAYIGTGKILYTVRDFPLAFHAHAKEAAVAARCAGELGQYWAMVHQLFENQKHLGSSLYPEQAKVLNLREKEFEDCLKDPKQVANVEKDLTYGKSIGVGGTPYFFIGRIEGKKLVKAQRISGARPFSNFSTIIDSLLE